MERTFDPWQQEAIAISGGRHLVLAPPGCGKTDILTERVVHAHNCGVDYADMLCLTFTNRAAKGMAQRIADRTGNPVPGDLFVGNIHRFCSQLLFNNGVVNHNSAIIDEGDVENIIQEELCKRLNITSRTTELMRFQHGLQQMVLGMRGELVLHNELFHAGAVAKLCDVLQMPFDEEHIAQIYCGIEDLMQRYPSLAEQPAANMMLLARAYERYKADNDLLDYDDLLVLAYQYLSEQASPLPYRWIEVDEVQDLNPLQFALVDLFAAPDATIVYLGDEQQAIFSFIGAKLETLESLKRRCGKNIHHLHTNYRSPRYLLDLQNDFAVANLGIGRNMLPTTDLNPSHAPEDLCLLNVGDAQMESYYAARFAKRYGEMDDCRQDAGAPSRVAILVSTNREADDIGEVMSGMGISHFKISGTDLFSLPAMRIILSHISVLTDEMVFIAWARLLWGLKVMPTYTAARNFMRDMRRVALLPTDFLLYPDSSYLQEFVRAYDTEELVIYDTETTGLDPYTDDIIQIAAVKVRNGKVTGKPFNIILETDKELPETVGGHPNPMLEVYRNSRRHSRAEGLRLFMDYCQGHTLVGHNVGYDYQILLHNLRRSCPELDLERLCPRYFDTLKYIRLVRPRLRQYKLGHLLEVLHLEGQNSHQADDDILATLSLLNFCHLNATQMLADQRLFIADHQKQVDKFHAKYADIYRHGIMSGERRAENGEQGAENTLTRQPALHSPLSTRTTLHSPMSCSSSTRACWPAASSTPSTNGATCCTSSTPTSSAPTSTPPCANSWNATPPTSTPSRRPTSAAPRSRSATSSPPSTKPRVWSSTPSSSTAPSTASIPARAAGPKNRYRKTPVASSWPSRGRANASASSTTNTTAAAPTPSAPSWRRSRNISPYTAAAATAKSARYNPHLLRINNPPL
ncbi:MAG: UvrD-helicase domain-containing protein [Bacteroidales bacterium]|nr:UvrD-helicase domain-containing protein [Bacteroidales bacterium]